VKSGSHECQSEKRLGVLSSELGCVSGLGPRLSSGLHMSRLASYVGREEIKETSEDSIEIEN